MSETVTVGQSAGASYTWLSSSIAWNSATATAKTWATAHDAAYTADIASTLDFVEGRACDVSAPKAETLDITDQGSPPCLKFTSTNYVTIPYIAALDQINTVTMEAWMRFTASANLVGIEKSDNNTSYQFQIFSAAQGSGVGGELVFMLQPVPAGWVTSGVASNDGEWHFVVGTYDRTTNTAKIYLDGAPRNTNSACTSGPTSNTQPLLINARGALGYGNGGSTALLRIYSRVLDATEIAEHYQGIFKNDTGLVGRWDLDDGSGTTAADKSSNANHGTLVGSPVWNAQVGGGRFPLLKNVATPKSETFATADVRSSVFAADRQFAETFLTAETYGNVSAYSRQLAETFAAADAYVKIASFDRQLAEGFATAESHVKVASFDRQLAEAFATAETSSKDSVIPLVETFATAESYGDVVAFDRQASETFATVEGSARAVAIVSAETLAVAESRAHDNGKSISEAFSTAEAYTNTAVFNREVAEVFSILGGGYVWQNASFTWAAAGAETWADTTRVVKSVGVAKGEALAAADQVGFVASFSRQLAEAFAMLDSASCLSTFNRQIAETIATVDGASHSIGFLREFAETFQTTSARSMAVSALYGEVIGAIGSTRFNIDKLLSESLSATDVQSVSAVFVRDIAEGFQTTDASAKVADKQLAETLSTVDFIAKLAAKEAAETIALIESLGRVATFNKSVAEGFSATDALAKIASISKVEAFAIGDLLRRSANATFSDILIGIEDIGAVEFAALLAAGSPAGFSGFVPFVPGDHSYQRAIIKATFESSAVNTTRATDMKVIIDVPDIDDSGFAAISIGGSTINFARPFNAPPEVVVSLKSGTIMARPRITTVQKTYFTVELIDAAGVSVAGNISWNAQGY